MVLPACRSDVLRFFHISHMFRNHDKHVGNCHIKSVTAETVSLARISPAAGQKYHSLLDSLELPSCGPHAMLIVQHEFWFFSNPFALVSLPGKWWGHSQQHSQVQGAEVLLKPCHKNGLWRPALLALTGNICKWRWTRTSLSATGST